MTFTQLRAERSWKAWKGWNYQIAKRFEPSKHKHLILLSTFLVILAIGYAWAQQPNNELFHSYTGASLQDPYTLLYHATDPTHDASEFSCLITGGLSNCHSTGTYGY